MRNIRGRKAFTLIELIVVIIIIGILATLAVVSYQAVINRAEDSTGEVAALSVAREVQALAAFDSFKGDTVYTEADPGANPPVAERDYRVEWAAEVDGDTPDSVESVTAASTGIQVETESGDIFCVQIASGATVQSVAHNTPNVVKAPC